MTIEAGKDGSASCQSWLTSARPSRTVRAVEGSGCHLDQRLDTNVFDVLIDAKVVLGLGQVERQPGRWGHAHEAHQEAAILSFCSAADSTTLPPTRRRAWNLTRPLVATV